MEDVGVVVVGGGSELEADVEELPAVELAPVVALLDDVDVEGRRRLARGVGLQQPAWGEEDGSAKIGTGSHRHEYDR